MKRNLLLVGVALVALVALWAVCRRPASEREAASAPAGGLSADQRVASMEKPIGGVSPEESAPSSDADEPAEAGDDAGSRAVDAFDALVDGWMEARPGGVAMKDVEGFRAAFARVPDVSKDECLQRALNLIPDENILLLAGILLDKSQGRAVLEAVFNDILNRDDQAKLPILKNLYKDRAHPCWADAAWVLDVTGEVPSDAQSR